MSALSRIRQFAFWSAGAVLATGGLLAILVLEYRSPSPRHALYVVGIPEKGQALFFGEKRCSSCHAVNGVGGHVGPDLSGIHPVKPAMGWLATALWNHAPGMWKKMSGATPPQLDQLEMAHMLAFL